jgi:hypothetical protein
MMFPPGGSKVAYMYVYNREKGGTYCSIPTHSARHVDYLSFFYHGNYTCKKPSPYNAVTVMLQILRSMKETYCSLYLERPRGSLRKLVIRLANANSYERLGRFV